MYPQTSYVKILIPDVIILGGRAFGRCVGHEDGVLMNRVSARMKETPQTSLAPSAMLQYNMKSATQNGALIHPNVGTLLSVSQPPELQETHLYGLSATNLVFW